MWFKMPRGKDSIPSLIIMTAMLLLVSNEAQAYEMCEPALQHLVKHGVATSDLIKQLPSTNGSSICGGGACCVPRLSSLMMGRGRHILKKEVQQKLDKLSFEITSAADDFRVAIKEALKDSEMRALHALKASYPRLVNHARIPLHKLFQDFDNSLSNNEDEDQIDRALKTFWNDLFPMVYHTIIHNKLPPFSPAYVDCLRESRSKIRPWKNLHKTLGETLVRGIEALRLTLHLLSVAADTVFKARQYRIPEECGEPAARLYFCSACHGAIVAPCSGLCLNIARGCLAPMAEIDIHWSLLVSTTAKLEASIKGSKISSLLKEFPERLSDALMIVMQSGTKLQKLVRNKCGQYTHSQRDESQSRSDDSSLQENSNIEEVTTKQSNIELLARTAVIVMESSQGFWASLADSLCLASSPRDKYCWDGLRVSEYSRATTGLGTSSQKYNAEVRVDKYDVELFSIPNILRSAKQLVTRRLSLMPDSMNYRRAEEIEGSGYRGRKGHRNRNSDDDDSEDDGYEGSGDLYGSGDGHIITPNPIDLPPSCPECQNSQPMREASLYLLGSLSIIVIFNTIFFI